MQRRVHAIESKSLSCNHRGLNSGAGKLIEWLQWPQELIHSHRNHSLHNRIDHYLQQASQHWPKSQLMQHPLHVNRMQTWWQSDQIPVHLLVESSFFSSITSSKLLLLSLMTSLNDVEVGWMSIIIGLTSSAASDKIVSVVILRVDPICVQCVKWTCGRIQRIFLYQRKWRQQNYLFII